MDKTIIILFVLVAIAIIGVIGAFVMLFGIKSSIEEMNSEIRDTIKSIKNKY